MDITEAMKKRRDELLAQKEKIDTCVIMLGHAGKFCKALASLSSGYLPISARLFSVTLSTFAPGFLLCLFSDPISGLFTDFRPKHFPASSTLS